MILLRKQLSSRSHRFRTNANEDAGVSSLEFVQRYLGPNDLAMDVTGKAQRFGEHRLQRRACDLRDRYVHGVLLGENNAGRSKAGILARRNDLGRQRSILGATSRSSWTVVYAGHCSPIQAISQNASSYRNVVVKTVRQRAYVSSEIWEASRSTNSRSQSVSRTYSGWAYALIQAA